jgi:hypothetical protein
MLHDVSISLLSKTRALENACLCELYYVTERPWFHTDVIISAVELYSYIPVQELTFSECYT